jgi:signal transduction histidine kinase
MNLRVKLRLATLVFVILVVMALIGWNSYVVVTTMPMIGTTPQELRIVQAQYAQIAREFLPSIQELDRTLFRAVTVQDRTAREEFHNRSEKLRATLQEWRERFRAGHITILRPFSFDADVRTLLNNLISAYGSYLQRAQEAMGREGESRDPQTQLTALEEANSTYRMLWAFGNRAAAHQEALALLLGAHTESMSREPWQLVRMFVLLLVLIGLCIALLMTAYRMVVRPLHAEVTEKALIIERQGKLASLGELAAVLAHEIRNPLTSINARLYTLHKSLAVGTEEEMDACVIGDEIKRLDGIVRDFLTLARPTEPKFTTISAEPLLKEVHALMAPSLKKHGLEFKLGATVPDSFRGDAHQLKQVLINLVQNASDSIEQTGTVTMQARSGRYQLGGDSREVVFLEVTDTGHGIPEEVRGKLFDPFFSTKDGGTGLGLPIAKRIVLQHGGELDFQTQLGRGTTFRVILPVDHTESQSHG